MSTEFYWVAVALVTIVSSARITRLVTFDDFPPTMRLRHAWGNLMDRSKKTEGYAILTFCQWCFSFWATWFVLAWADVAGVLDGKPLWGGEGSLSQPLWWIINGALAASYLAAILMTHDGDSGRGDDEDGGV